MSQLSGPAHLTGQILCFVHMCPPTGIEIVSFSNRFSITFYPAYRDLGSVQVRSHLAG